MTLIDIAAGNSVRLAALVVTLSAASGAVASCLLHESRLRSGDAPRHALLLGIRVGLSVAALAAALLVTTLVVRAFGAKTASEDISLRVTAWRSAFALAAALLSTVPAGAAGGILGLALRRPDLGRRTAVALFSLVPGAATARKKVSAYSYLRIAIVCTAIAGFCSPILLLVLPLKQGPTRQAPPSALPTPSPSFRYERPRLWELARPEQIVVSSRRRLEMGLADGPTVFSPDSQYLAGILTNGGVVIWDLDQWKAEAEFPIVSPPSHLEWSPDGRRLAHLIARPRAMVGIFELARHRFVDLPQPKDRDLPLGPMRWLDDATIALYPSDEPPLALDLESLRLTPLVGSNSWSKLTPAQREACAKPRSQAFPKAAEWYAMAVPRLIAATPPSRKALAEPWAIQGQSFLAFADRSSPIVSTFSDVPLGQGEQTAWSPDACKLLLSRPGSKEVLFFGLLDRSVPAFTVKMPCTRQSVQGDTQLQSLIKTHTLCAIAYSPLVNPLTGKVVGPDRERIHGLLRMIDWDGSMAKWWVSDEYSAVQPGDVVADIHAWTEGTFAPAARIADRNWWTVAGKTLALDRGTVPPRGAASPLGINSEVSVSPGTYACQIGSIVSGRAASPPTAPPSQPAVATEADSRSSQPEQPQRQVEDQVTAFVRRHHEKASARDLEGLMADYADKIVVLDGGKEATISAAQLRQRETDDMRKWPKGNEFPTFESVSAAGEAWSVKYVLHFRETATDGRIREGEAEIGMLILGSPEAPKIFSQKVVVRKVETAQVAAPTRQSTIQVTVGKPCYVGSFRASDSRDIEISDALHMEEGAAEMHRTYRRLAADGKVLSSCRAKYRGVAQSVLDGVTVTFSEQSWARQDSDPDFVKQCSRSAESLVGQTINYYFRGPDLVEPNTGTIFRLIK